MTLMSKLRLLPLVAALALPGCQTEESGPVTIRIFNRNPATGEYGEFDASFPTLADAHTLRGALGAVKTHSTWLLSDDVQGSAGFRVEGRQREAWVVDGRRVDVHVAGRLATDGRRSTTRGFNVDGPGQSHSAPHRAEQVHSGSSDYPCVHPRGPVIPPRGTPRRGSVHHAGPAAP